MATLLYRLGRTAYRRWPVFVAGWLLALVGGGLIATGIAKPMVDTFSIPGIPSLQAQQTQQQVVRREHDADARQDGVELVVRERQRLCIGLPPLQLDAILGRALTALVQQLGREVAGHHGGAGASRRDGHVSGAGRHVEHAITRGDAGRLDNDRSELGDEIARQRGVVAERPHRPVLRLERAIGLDRIHKITHVPCRPSLSHHEARVRVSTMVGNRPSLGLPCFSTDPGRTCHVLTLAGCRMRVDAGHGASPRMREEPMKANVGDHLVVQSQHLDKHVRDGEILEVNGPEGTPPYLVRWSDDGHESVCFPGPDAHVEPAAR